MDNNSYDKIKSCNCMKEFCQFVLLSVVSRMGGYPEVITEMSCNKTLLEANKAQAIISGWVSSEIYSVEPERILWYHPESDSYGVCNYGQFMEMNRSEGVDDVTGVPHHEEEYLKIQREKKLESL
jgi:hypothetical protein